VPPPAPEPPPAADPVQLLDRYLLALSNLSAPGEILSVAFSDGTSNFRVEVDFGDSLRGVLDTVAGTYALNAANALSINSDAADSLLGVFNVSITATIEIPEDDDPSAGTWQVEFLEPGGTGQPEIVTVTVVSGGMNVSLDGGQPLFLAWADVENLFGDDQAPGWQRRAALSALVAGFVVEQADLARRSVVMIDDSLESNGSATVMCDAFTGTPPPGVLNQGMFTLSWLGSGEITEGDGFVLEYTDCWFADGDQGELANGAVNLAGYLGVIDGNTLINFGFLDAANAPGGLTYNGPTLASTVRDPSGSYTVDPSETLTITGGFAISFLGAVQ
jgi:hypothetical protein